MQRTNSVTRAGQKETEDKPKDEKKSHWETYKWYYIGAGCVLVAVTCYVYLPQVVAFLGNLHKSFSMTLPPELAENPRKIVIKCTFRTSDDNTLVLCPLEQERMNL